MFNDTSFSVHFHWKLSPCLSIALLKHIRAVVVKFHPFLAAVVHGDDGSSCWLAKWELFEPRIEEIHYHALLLTEFSLVLLLLLWWLWWRHLVAAPAAAAGLQQWAEAIQTQHLIICGVVLLAISHIQTQRLFIFVLTSCLVSLLLSSLLQWAQVLRLSVMQHPAFIIISKEWPESHK